jgi:hypothetical protein
MSFINKSKNMVSTNPFGDWWRKWPAWIGYVTSIWSLAYGLLGFYWAVGGVGFPFGKNDPTEISILSQITQDGGAPVIAAVGFVSALIAAFMAQRRGSGILRTLIVGFAWLVSAGLLLIIPDYRVLMAVAYGFVFLAGAPFNWPPASYFDIFIWPVVNQFFILAGGFLWSAAALAYGRLTASACGHCGRTDQTPFWKTPAGTAEWGKWATYLAVLNPLLYAITRFAWALGIPLGITEELLREGQVSGAWLAGAALATVAIIGAILTLGLIQPWGERFPTWIPFWGGKRVPPALAIIPAALISVLVTSAGLMYVRLTLTGVFDEQFGPGNPATYGPELLWPVWGIALGAATLAYYYRRRGRCQYCGRL